MEKDIPNPILKREPTMGIQDISRPDPKKVTFVEKKSVLTYSIFEFKSQGEGLEVSFMGMVWKSIQQYNSQAVLAAVDTNCQRKTICGTR